MDGPPNEGGELQSIHNNHDEYFTFSGHDDEYVERFTTLQFGGDCWVGLYTYLRTTTAAFFIVIFSICGCRIGPFISFRRPLPSTYPFHKHEILMEAFLRKEIHIVHRSHDTDVHQGVGVNDNFYDLGKSTLTFLFEPSYISASIFRWWPDVRKAMHIFVRTTFTSVAAMASWWCFSSSWS